MLPNVSGDFLLVPTFVVFCTTVLHHRIHLLKLAELRSRFNEADDLDPERTEKLAAFPDM
jgi:hypothetical protein